MENLMLSLSECDKYEVTFALPPSAGDELLTANEYRDAQYTTVDFINAKLTRLNRSANSKNRVSFQLSFFVIDDNATLAHITVA